MCILTESTGPNSLVVPSQNSTMKHKSVNPVGALNETSNSTKQYLLTGCQQNIIDAMNWLEPAANESNSL